MSLVGVPRRRVAYLVTSSGVGGAEMQVCEFARAFSRREWNVDVDSILSFEAPILDLETDGVPTRTFGMRRAVPPAPSSGCGPTVANGPPSTLSWA